MDDPSQFIIDDIYSAIYCFGSLNDDNRNALAEALFDLGNHGMLMITETNPEYVSPQMKNSVIILFYFIMVLSQKAETVTAASEVGCGTVQVQQKSNDDDDDDEKVVVTKTKKNGNVNTQWNEWRFQYLQFVNKIATLDQSLLFTMGIVPEQFLSLAWSLALKIFEASYLSINDTMKKLCVDIIANCVTVFASTSGSLPALTTAIIDAIVRSEHMAVNAAAIVVNSKCTVVANEIMLDISNWNMGAISSTGAKNIGIFIETIAELNPSLMTTYMPVIKHQVDSSAHQVRSSLLRAIGSVISYVHRIHNETADHLESVVKNEDTPATDTSESDDAQPKPLNKLTLARVRDSLIDLLVERTHDTSHFTRAAGLKVWQSLVDTHSLPVFTVSTAVDVAIDRIKDKSINVRKNAVNTLVSLIDNNPFSGSLDTAIFEQRATELDALFKERVEQLRATSAKEDKDDVTEVTNTAGDVAIIDPFLESPDVIEDTQIQSIKVRQEHCKCALKFIHALTNSVQSIEALLHSTNTSDVVAALKFITRAVAFNIKGSGMALSNAFSLVWHTEAAIVNEIVTAFFKVYITDGSEEDVKLSPHEISGNLIQVTNRCKESIVSLEKIIGELIKKEMVDPYAIVTSLWKTLEHLGTTDTVASDNGQITKGATIHVIAIIAKYYPNIITPSKVRIISQICFNKEAMQENNTYTMRSGAQCLLACPSYFNCNDHEMKEAYNVAVTGLRDIIIGTYCGENEEITRGWLSVCEECMHAVFHIHPCPDKILGSVIAPVYESLGLSSDACSPTVLCSNVRLARFLFILGQGALNAVVYTEFIANEAKKASVKKESKSNNKTTTVDSMEEEMGMIAAVDAEHDRIFTRVTEHDLIFENLLGKFHPVIAFIVANDKGNYSNLLLRETAIFALSRYMTVSSRLCETYLSLLFTVLVKEQSDAIKTSIVIALGDLAFRFPNALEPWTGHMYARLTDNSVVVRYNALMVLTHLILNDMIKVKGQVSHIVCCLCDPVDAIKDLATLFFMRLSERSNNPVYNLLGDIIASLSSATNDENTGATVVTTEKFQTIMKFLLCFVKKDKQADGLLERLVLRIGLADSLQQRRNLAFCISELSITEKGVKKMVELVKHIKDALYDGQIYDYFKISIQKAKKIKAVPASGSTQGEVKSIIEEFEQFMEAIKNGDDFVMSVATNASANDENAAASNVNEGVATAKPKKKTTKKTVKKSKKAAHSDDDDDVDAGVDDVDDEMEVVKKSTSRRRVGRSALNEITNEDD